MSDSIGSSFPSGSPSIQQTGNKMNPAIQNLITATQGYMINAFAPSTRSSYSSDADKLAKSKAELERQQIKNDVQKKRKIRLCNNESCHKDKKRKLVNKPKANVIAQLPLLQPPDRISPVQQRTHIVPAYPAKNPILKKLVLQNEKQQRSINSLKRQIVHLHEAVGSVTKVARELLECMQTHYENEPLERTWMCKAIPEERVAYPGHDSTFLQEDSAFHPRSHCGCHTCPFTGCCAKPGVETQRLELGTTSKRE
ncbi:hypothetical protein EOD39_7095 [Acipenser ruthenus]|uniref:Uncharacterized protein n=1 Tax=Acipenser ruthenus TaxID=7906 RepID=A0A662YXF2_ACIRT|nr:hypothetical protein EOD39_7095 [Acipenser ruthenus]